MKRIEVKACPPLQSILYCKYRIEKTYDQYFFVKELQGWHAYNDSSDTKKIHERDLSFCIYHFPPQDKVAINEYRYSTVFRYITETPASNQEFISRLLDTLKGVVVRDLPSYDYKNSNNLISYREYLRTNYNWTPRENLIYLKFNYIYDRVTKKLFKIVPKDGA